MLLNLNFMLKKILTIFIMAICANVLLFAQDISVVRQFGNNLSNWASGDNSFSSLENIEQLCSKKPAFRASDNLMQTLARKNGLEITKNYPLDNYIGCLQKEIDNGVSISFSNIKNILSSEINNYKSGYNYVSCNIGVSGSTNLNESALFILVNNKIAGIQDYVTTVDRKSGKRKIEVDWSGFSVDEDSKGWGLSYNYSKSFPIGATIEYSVWKFMLGLDFGINNDKDIYTTQKVDFTNIVDYKITKCEYDLKYFLTATPSFYLKYFSVGCGFGYAYLSGKKITKDNMVTIYPDESSVQSGSTSTVDDYKFKFMIRPTVKGYIPCNDNFSISLSVNYDWIQGYKEKSGIGFGIGFHYIIDNY